MRSLPEHQDELLVLLQLTLTAHSCTAQCQDVRSFFGMHGSKQPSPAFKCHCVSNMIRFRLEPFFNYRSRFELFLNNDQLELEV